MKNLKVMRVFRLNNFFSIFILTSFFSIQAHSARVIGLKFADSIELGPKKLTLNGIGLRKAEVALGLKVNVYAAALYLENKSQNAEDIIKNPSPKIVKLGYARSVGKEKARETWTTNFEKLCLGPQNPCSKEKSAFTDQFLPAIGDMEEDQFQEFIIDGTTLTISAPKKSKVTIENTNLGIFLLRVWLQNPPNPEVSEGLLGLKDFSKE
jgi:hypothetical protein